MGWTYAGANGIADWRRLRNSDADSVEIDPLLYDPQQWRLLPGSPGHKQGPNGKDHGADVDKLDLAKVKAK
jgi:hypothetical protein